jgi:LacI family transcriptional regulator
MAGGLAAARKLLAAEHRPRAIFASADVQAIGAIRACAELGLRVPDDVAIVSFDGSDACEFSTPPLTSVTQSVAEMAEVAIARLLGEASSEPGEQVTIPTELVLRRSCGCDEG